MLPDFDQLRAGLSRASQKTVDTVSSGFPEEDQALVLEHFHTACTERSDMQMDTEITS